ncbi:CpsD/CapB family tyrosine-protein kinase [Clostridium sp. YIM B02551]|uniref:CpsD/CapB family tyrosine-protein kinase n=1 Tax=Clostridium sp. YIM B02551 TaxID=2910679 RepID=UPI001EEA9553
MIKDIVIYNDPKSSVSEAYRTLRSNIQFSLVDQESSIIAVTSCGPGEGKSTVIANLAVAMAQAGKRTLLIDCDLRKPIIHKKFGASNTHGLTTLLLKESTIEESIFRVDVPNLEIIPSGPIPPNPSEMLGSKNMKKLLSDLKGAFEVILIDTPPVLVVSDTFVLSPSIDGTLIVAAYGTTEKAAILKAKDSLVKVGAKILGVVENKIPDNARGYGYGSSKYYNSYYSGD